MAATLVTPNQQYEQSYLEGLKELQADPNRNMSTHSDFQSNRETFSEYLERLADYEKGQNLPHETWVSESILWLVEGDEWIGKVSIRHRLTDYLRKFGGNIGYEIRPSKRRQGYGKKILELGIEAAHDLGIDEILITCDATNIGSKKIIEHNGGVLIDEMTEEKTQNVKKRYMISSQK